MMLPAVVPGTLYADWLRRRESLGAYQGSRAPIVAIQLRVLDYLLERYRDDAAALLPAPPPLESVYLNQRAIVVNHHRSLGLVAGVKSAHEAANRINLVLARMYDPARIAEDSAVDLERPAVAEDPWFDWIEPSDRTIREFWFNKMGISRRRLLRRSRIVESAMQRMPFLPKATVHELYLNIVRGKGHAVEADVIRQMSTSRRKSNNTNTGRCLLSTPDVKGNWHK